MTPDGYSKNAVNEAQLPATFGVGLATVKLFQDAFLAHVQEYDIRPGGEIDIRMTLPSDPRSRRIILGRARILRNEVTVRTAQELIDRATETYEATRSFLERARSRR